MSCKKQIPYTLYNVHLFIQYLIKTVQCQVSQGETGEPCFNRQIRNQAAMNQPMTLALLAFTVRMARAARVGWQLWLCRKAERLHGPPETLGLISAPQCNGARGIFLNDHVIPLTKMCDNILFYSIGKIFKSLLFHPTTQFTPVTLNSQSFSHAILASSSVQSGSISSFIQKQANGQEGVQLQFLSNYSFSKYKYIHSTLSSGSNISSSSSTQKERKVSLKMGFISPLANNMCASLIS